MVNINEKAYKELIQQDIEKLNQYMPEESLERKHIEVVLNWSVRAMYPVYGCNSIAVKMGHKHCNICSGKGCPDWGQKPNLIENK